MGQFPQLIEEDFQRFNLAMMDLLTQSEASAALIVEKAGYLIQQCGKDDTIDTTTLATLASNAFNATQFMASQILREDNFSGMYQQGEKVSTLILNIEENSLLVVIFPADRSVGLVKYYAGQTIRALADQLQIAQARAPGQGFDFIDLNATDITGLFRRKDPVPEAPPADPPPQPAAPESLPPYLQPPPEINPPPGVNPTDEQPPSEGQKPAA